MISGNAVAQFQITKLSVPRHIPRGSDANLTCDFDLDGTELYFVKWSFDDKEFFR